MRSKFVVKEIELTEKQAALSRAGDENLTQIEEIGKLLKKPTLAYRLASEEKKRILVDGSAERTKVRTLDQLLTRLLKLLPFLPGDFSLRLTRSC